MSRTSICKEIRTYRDRGVFNERNDRWLKHQSFETASVQGNRNESNGNSMIMPIWTSPSYLYAVEETSV